MSQTEEKGKKKDKPSCCCNNKRNPSRFASLDTFGDMKDFAQKYYIKHWEHIKPNGYARPFFIVEYEELDDE